MKSRCRNLTHLMLSAALAAVLGLGLALPFTASAHDAEHFSAGEPGDPRKSARIVTVIMKETDDGKMLFEPRSVHVKKGEQIKFIIRNIGALPHEFVLANEADNLKHAALMQKYPDMEHDDPNGKTLQPKTTAELLWRFSKAGAFEFSCLIPGHRESGMLGNVTVK